MLEESISNTLLLQYIMDPVTHISAGALGAQFLRKPLRRDRYLLVFCMLAAWLPDVDNFIGFLGPELYLIHHRSLTHSFLGGMLLAAVFTWVFRIFVKTLAFKRGFLLAYAFILVHIFLDLITSYGTQIFFPFTNARYTLACVFIIDPLYTLVMGYFLFRSVRSSEQRRSSFAMVGLVWILMYPMLNLGIRYGLESHVERQLIRHDVAFKQLSLSPDALSPFFWKVIVEHENSYEIGGLSLFRPLASLEFSSFQKADPEIFLDLARDADLFKTFAWFFDYPVMDTVRDGKTTSITFGDLRFASTLPFLQNLRGETLPFALTAVLDEDGKLLEYHYHHPGRGKDIYQTN